MKGFQEIFKAKKITVLGLGLLGRGVGDVEFLAKCGADVLVTDKKSEDQLQQSVDKLKMYPHVSFRLGGHDVEDFKHCDLVVKAAGVRLDSAEIMAAKEAGVQVAMSTALFAKYAAEAGAKIVGVTGTRGKSTVSHMIYHALKTAGKRAFLGGNVRGVSTLALLPAIEAGDIAVLELDSWQLQGFGDLQMSPHIAVFTNLMPDHQNYYPSMDAYFADKANIFRYQKTGDTLIIGPDIESRVRAVPSPIEPLIPEKLAPDWMLKIPGEHNQFNAACAASALLALGLTVDKIQQGLESFEGVEGRLQLVGEVNGVKIYNDNNATTPEATVAALKALQDGDRNSIILIMGGSDKGLEIDQLIEEARSTCKKIVLLAGSGTERVQAAFPDAILCTNLNDAFSAAMDSAAEGDIILFSPAFASFGMFENEYDRNDQFMRIIETRM